jgi:hypothetical protein
MSALFEELDYRATPIGALSLRRRRELRLGLEMTCGANDGTCRRARLDRRRARSFGSLPAHRSIREAETCFRRRR